MIVATTPSLEGYEIVEYIDIVSGHSIIGCNAAKDFLAGFTGFMGGRSTSYEKVVRKAEDAAKAEIIAEARDRGANAIVGLHLDFEVLMLKEKDTFLCMAASGTAVKVEKRTSTPKSTTDHAASTPKQNWDRLAPELETTR